VSSADAVYFPGRDCVLLLQHIPLDTVKRVIGDLCSQFSTALKASLDRGNNRFLGVLVSHGRPYHFYYDIAPTVYELDEVGLLPRLPALVHYPGADFCSFSDLLNVQVDEIIQSCRELSSNTAGKGFYVHVGYPYSSERETIAKHFDRRLLARARSTIDLECEDYQRAIKCYPLIWFGLTVEKRCWLEQVEGTAELIKELKKEYPSLGVIFDGWTSPLVPTGGDRSNTECDKIVEQKIKELIPSDINTFSVIGKNSLVKVNYARLVDAFVGNSGTGTLHVGRFAGKPGVGHLNTKMIDIPGHIRPNVVLIDKTHIVDQPGSEGLRMDFISYSIGWRTIYDRLLPLISG